MMFTRIEGRLGGPRLRTPQETELLLARAGVHLRPVAAEHACPKCRGERRKLNKYPGGRRSDREWSAAVAGLVDSTTEIDQALARLRSAA